VPFRAFGPWQWFFRIYWRTTNMGKQNAVLRTALFCVGMGFAGPRYPRRNRQRAGASSPFHGRNSKSSSAWTTTKIVFPLETFPQTHRPDRVKRRRPRDRGGPRGDDARRVPARCERHEGRRPTPSRSALRLSLTKAAYSGKMARTGTRFAASFHIHVLKKNCLAENPPSPPADGPRRAGRRRRAGP